MAAGHLNRCPHVVPDVRSAQHQWVYAELGVDGSVFHLKDLF